MIKRQQTRVAAMAISHIGARVSDHLPTFKKEKSVFCHGAFQIQDVSVVTEDPRDNKDPALPGHASGFCVCLCHTTHNPLMFAVPSQASQGQHAPGLLKTLLVVVCPIG